MAKQKQPDMNTWSGRMKEWGGGDFTFLSSDGETLIFIVVGLPEKLKSVYKGKEQERIGIPIVTEDGFQLLIGGKRLARKLTKHERKFSTTAFMVTRVGTEGDVNAKYPIKEITDKDTFDRLSAIKDEDFVPEMIQEAVAESAKVLEG